MQNAPQQRHLYLTDTYLTKSSTTIAFQGTSDRTNWIALADNPFHPQGGGQPADYGTVDGCEVTPFRLPENRSVIALRIEATDIGFSKGQSVIAEIDKGRRLLHAALHTAGHVLQAVTEARDWNVVANNHFPGQSRIEFVPTNKSLAALNSEAGRAELLSELRDAVNKALSSSAPITATEGNDGFRIVSLGDWHSTPCGGTHVHNVNEILNMQLSSLKFKGGRVRIAYDAKHIDIGAQVA